MTLTFVDNIPLEHLALEVGNNSRHMPLKDVFQLRRSVVVCSDPGGELGVPGEGVSTDLLVMLLGPVHQGIGGGEVALDTAAAPDEEAGGRGEGPFPSGATRYAGTRPPFGLSYEIS